MNHPIQNRIGAVFVPASDLVRAAAWYSRLLGLPVGATSLLGMPDVLPRSTVDYHLSVDSEDEFVNVLKLILNSRATRQVISALLSQINVRKTKVLSP